jgi:signal transduction histidine kinase
VRNPLTPIAVSVADLKRSYDQKRPDFPAILDQAVRTIGEEVESLKRLLKEFSEFGSLPPARPAPFDVSDLVADLRTLYGREVAEGRLRLSDAAGRTRVTADRAQLRQALVNLVKNGLEAIDGRGSVEVSVERDAGALTFAVADDGPGLTAGQRAQLFVPNFTTKPTGSGLGLTIVERIVTEHRGAITVDSAPGRGTTFRVRLPLA